MSDVIPTGTTRDSQYLFDRMTEVTLRLAAPGPGRRVLDVARGFGHDALAMTRAGAEVVGVEPSQRMSAWARLRCAEGAGAPPRFVRGWSDALPFADASFDAALCKGAIDHFDRPQRAIREMARVTRREGRVVLAIANFESLACRASRWLDHAREGWLARPVRRGRRHYDVPADHFTRYDLGLMREQAERFLELERLEGISLGWGTPGWSRLVEALPSRAADAALQALGRLAVRLPGWADVVVLAGRPRREGRSSTSSR